MVHDPCQNKFLVPLLISFLRPSVTVTNPHALASGHARITGHTVSVARRVLKLPIGKHQLPYRFSQGVRCKRTMSRCWCKPRPSTHSTCQGICKIHKAKSLARLRQKDLDGESVSRRQKTVQTSTCSRTHAFLSDTNRVHGTCSQKDKTRRPN